MPSAFVLWIMRELPPPITNQQKQSRIITFVSCGTDDTNPPRQGWASATSSKNKVSLSHSFTSFSYDQIPVAHHFSNCLYYKNEALRNKKREQIISPQLFQALGEIALVPFHSSSVSL